MADPLSYFFANAKPESPLSYEALQTRRRIAEQIMGKRSPYPKTLGEGLTSIGENIGDVLAFKSLEEKERQQAAREAEILSGAGALPGARPAAPPTQRPPGTPATPPPRPYNSTDAAPALGPRDAVTAALVPPPDEEPFTAASEPAQTPSIVSRAPVNAGVPLPPPRPVRDRSTQLAEMQADPRIMQRLMETTAGELNAGYSPREGQIQFQTALDRAGARGIPVSQALETYTGRGSRGYYPPEVVPRGARALQDPERMAAFQRDIVDPVLRGADPGREQFGFTPTGNASLGVAQRGVESGRYNRYGKLPGRGETFVQQETPQQLALLDEGRVPPRGTPAGAPQDAMGAILAATRQSGAGQPIPFSQAATMGPEPDDGAPQQPQQMAQAQPQRNPMIPRPDIVPLPRPAPAASGSAGIVPGPFDPVVPEPQQPTIPTTPASPEAATTRARPVAPRPSPISDEETRGAQLQAAAGGNPRLQERARFLIQFGQQKRAAEDLRMIEEYRADLAAYEAERTAERAYIRGKPQADFKFTEEQREAARKDLERQQFPFGREKVLDLAKESHEQVKALPQANIAIQNVRGLLSSDAGMFTGSPANIALSLNKWAQAFGVPYNPKSMSKTENTEAFKAFMVPILAQLRPAVIGQGQQTAPELKLLQDAAAGNITLERGSIEKVLNAIERLNEVAAVQHHKRLITNARGNEDMRAVLFGNYGLPMHEFVSPAKINMLRQNIAGKNPAQVKAEMEEFDKDYFTLGLAASLLGQ